MMIKKSGSGLIAALALGFCVGIFLPEVVQSSDEDPAIVRGKIGIQISNEKRSVLAKKRNRITTEDRLQVYVSPEFDSYIYVINSNKKTAQLLNPKLDGQTTSGKLKKYPGPDQYYQFDADSEIEFITIVVSPNKMSNIENLFAASEVSYDSWSDQEGEMVEASQAIASKEVNKETQKGGVVQPQSDGFRSSGNFLDKIPTRKGKSFLIKKYEFHVYNAKK